MSLTANFFLCQSRLSTKPLQWNQAFTCAFRAAENIRETGDHVGADFCGGFLRRYRGEECSGGGPDHPPAQFEFGAEDKHNWQGRSDERIKLAVMTALHWDLAVPRDRLQVSVTLGWVTLTGRVVREYEKSRAEADAAVVAGVAGVVNKITCDSRD